MSGSKLLYWMFACLVIGGSAITVLRYVRSIEAPNDGTQISNVPAESPEIVPLSVVADDNAEVQEKTASNSDTSDDGIPTAVAEHPHAPLQFPTWPKPALTLVITGEQLGYFEPCGCTENQLGGMSRRASLFTKIQSLGWDVRGIDLGSVIRRSGAQAKLKFETTLEALRELKYVGLALGPEELKLEPGYLLSQHLTDGETPLAFLGANLTFFGAKDLGTPLPSVIFEVNGVKVGVTSVMSNSIRKSVIPDMTPDEAVSAELQWSDPAEALTAVMQSFDEADVSVRILLAQSTLEESQKLAEDFPKLTMVVRANGFGEGKDRPDMVGSVYMLEVGKKGKASGVIGLYPDDAEHPVRFELVLLSGDLFSESERMTRLLQSYQDRLKSEALVKTDGALPYPSGATFVGASKCGECHTKAFEIWQATPHAHALESLDPANQRKGFDRLHGVNRTFDPECLSCHVAGWEPQEYFRYQSGFLNEEFAEDESEKQLQTLLAGNQCENCHGPGSRHIEFIEADNKEAAIKEMKVTLKQAKNKTCVQCHDADNSPKYKFETYWEDVKHYGKE